MGEWVSFVSCGCKISSIHVKRAIRVVDCCERLLFKLNIFCLCFLNIFCLR